MALIEGVGDEVTVLFGLVLLFLVLMLAWASTHTADRSEQLFHSSVASVASQRRTSNRSTSGESSLDSNFAETASVSTEAQDVKEVGKTSQSEDEDKNERPTEVDAASVDENEQHQEIGTENSQTASVHTSTDQPQSSSANNESLEDDSVLSRNMVLRLKFLNDTERVAQVKPGDTIGYIKRTYFPGQEHQVRLIYRGQLLRDDTQTLAALNLVNNSVLHCHISQNATQQMPAGAMAAEQVHAALNVGSLMVPLFVLMLSVLWYFQIQYRQLFTAPATASLVGITFFFSFVAFGVYRR
ncbi:transmembrane and ubiquitin-like domain-containing protein 1 [Erpetoichthys calabaricus]|uniref:transmembrane and ubiquitin-like domain-containing protein 1 n=1 Tax=Erpetoichthys calabaricus TaxID=27687 RepID=UPI00223401C4|nr:transmembrane and ubiquitin-like domain-containing protein 1 [Erpetoichthys calabaricus]